MAPTKRTGPRRWLRGLLWMAAGLALLLVLAVAGLWWRLNQGPIRLDFLEPRIESALNDLAAPVSVELGGTTLEWVGGGRPIEIQANDVRVLTPDGSELASFGNIGVGLYAPALLRGSVIPTSLVFRQTHAVLNRNENGSFDLGLGDTAEAPETTVPTPDLTDFLDQWIAPEDLDLPLARLAEISIADSRVDVHDRMMGVDWGAEKVAATLTRTDGALKADASSVLDVGEYRSEMSAAATYETSSKALRVELSFEDLVPSALAKSYPGLEVLATLDDPLSGSARATLAKAVHLRSAEIELEGARGSISARVSDVADDFSSFGGTLDVEKLKPWLFADLLPELKELSRVHLPVGAHVELEVAGKRVSSLSFEVKAGKGTVAIPEVYLDPLSIVSIELSGKAQDHFDRIEVGKIAAVLSDVALGGKISAVKRGDAYHADVKAGVESATIAEVGKYWPQTAAGGARKWVVDHISAAAVSDIELDMSVAVTASASGEDPMVEFGSFETTFAFGGISIDPLRPQPAVTGVHGTSTMTLDRLDFVVAGGRTQGIELGPSKVAITNLSGGDPVGLSLDLAISGPVESAAAVIVSPPLEIVPPDLLAGLRGQVAGRVKVSIPLEGETTRHDVHTSADVKLSDVQWKNSPVPLGDRELSDGVLDLHLDDDSLEVRGEIEVAGIPARVVYHENLAAGDPERRVVAHAVIDEAARRALDLPDQDYFSGAASLDVTYIGRRDGTSRIEARGDLADTVLEIPQVEWTKASGEGGHASGVFELTDDSWTLDPFEIDAGGLKANGTLVLDPDPTELRHLELERVQLGRSDFHASLSRDPGSGFRLRVEGPAFDAVPTIDYLKKVAARTTERRRAGEAADAGPRPPLDIGVRLDELRIARGSRLNAVTADYVDDGQWVSKVVVAAEMEPVSPERAQADPGANEEAEQPQVSQLDLSYLPKEDGHEVLFKTDNLGVLVDGLHTSTTLQGGTVVLSTARPARDAPFNGTLAITEFTLLGLPTLAKVLELGSLRGMSSGMSKEGLLFKSVKATLDSSGRRITISDGKALGRGFGITIRGTLDLAKNELDLEGAVTPMETIQRVIGHIPLIGRLLAGWNREGIIAVLYDVKGPMEDPELKVNGYSALTPGITREIYRLAPDDDDEDDSGGKKSKKNKKKVGDDDSTAEGSDSVQ